MYAWGDDRRYNSYAAYFRRIMGGRVQKVAINAGFTMPQPRRYGRYGWLHVLQQRSVHALILHVAQKHHPPNRRRHRVPPQPIPLSRAVPRLFPVVLQHLRAARPSARTLQRSPRPSARGGNHRRHAPRLRGRSQTRLLRLARPKPLRGTGIRHRIDIRRHAAGDKPRTRLRDGAAGCRDDCRTRAARRRALHSRSAGRERQHDCRTGRAHQRTAG